MEIGNTFQTKEEDTESYDRVYSINFEIWYMVDLTSSKTALNYNLGKVKVDLWLTVKTKAEQ